MPNDEPIQWLTTAPNPNVKATGFDASQRGWKLHAVYALDSATWESIKTRKAVCGVTPAHGWGVDLYIEDKCKNCMKKLSLCEE